MSAIHFTTTLITIKTAILLILVTAGTVHGQTFYDLGDPSIVHELNNHVAVFMDSSNQVSIDEVTQPAIQRKFRQNNGNLTFGYLPATIWLKIQTRSTTPGKQWFLEIPAPFLEYVDFYQLKSDGSWQHTLSGYFRKQSERAIPHTRHVAELQFLDDSTSTVYVQIGGVSPKTFTLHAIEENKFTEKVRAEDLGYGVFFGVLIFMLLYNLNLFLTLKQWNYFLYFFIIAFTLLIFAALSGYGGKFIWPENPAFNYINGKLILEVLIIFLTLYTIRFLAIRKYSRLMYYLLWSLIPLSVIAFLLSSTQIVNSAGNNLVTVSTLVFMTAGVVAVIKGNRAGTYFIVAWAFYFLGGLLLTLRNSGVLDYNFWTTHFVEIGAVVGVSIMGFGLGAQYRKLQKEKEEAQMATLRAQQDNTAKLEIKVNQRTEQLFQANRELQRTLETNRRQTQIIESKNAELDTFFYRVSHDLKGPVLSSMGLMALARMDVKDKLALEYIDRQHSQLERLSHIINGLVNLTKLNNGDLVRERIDFNRMIDDCILSFSHVPNFSQLHFEKEINSDMEFHSEWTLVNAILQNLIENSIKYSREESPFVRIKVFGESGSLVIQVEDNGLGIPKEHQDKIFEMFYRATEKANGSGLGLYILKRSVARLNGNIEIKSQVGVGSTFIVRLPLQSENVSALKL